MTRRLVVTTRVQLLEGEEVVLDVAGAYDRVVPHTASASELRGLVFAAETLATRDANVQLGPVLRAHGLR